MINPCTVLAATRSAVYLMDLNSRFTVRGFPDDGGESFGGTVTVLGATVWGAAKHPAYRVRLSTVWVYGDDGILRAEPMSDEAIVLADAISPDWSADFAPAGSPEPRWFSSMRAKKKLSR